MSCGTRKQQVIQACKPRVIAICYRDVMSPQTQGNPWAGTITYIALNSG